MVFRCLFGLVLNSFLKGLSLKVALSFPPDFFQVFHEEIIENKSKMEGGKNGELI